MCHTNTPIIAVHLYSVVSPTRSADVFMLCKEHSSIENSMAQSKRFIFVLFIYKFEFYRK